VPVRRACPTIESTSGETQPQTQSQAGQSAVVADPRQQQQQVAAEAAAAAPSSDAPVTTAQVVAEAASNGDATTLNELQAPPSGGMTDYGTHVVVAPKVGFWSDLLSGDFSGAAYDAYHDISSGLKWLGSELNAGAQWLGTNHQMSDALYVTPGFFPRADANLGAVSPIVNGAANIVNSSMNAILNTAAFVTSPIADNVGVITSTEAGIGLNPLVPVTDLLASASLGIRASEAAAPAQDTISVFRKMSSAEADLTIQTQQLQPPIVGTNSSKYLSESLSKVEAFQNAGVSGSTQQDILKFVLDKPGYDSMMSTAVNQYGSAGVDAVKYNFEGIPQTAGGPPLRNIGVPLSQLDQFNQIILEIKRLSGDGY
jgi:hypothetical protein